jgi:hypothetical protein
VPRVPAVHDGRPRGDPGRARGDRVTEAAAAARGARPAVSQRVSVVCAVYVRLTMLP